MNFLRMGVFSLLLLLWAHCSAFPQERPTDIISTFTVPDGLTVEQAAEPGLSSYPMFLNFDDIGNLFVCESTGKDISGKEMAAVPECLILRLVDEDQDGIFDTKTIFARELTLPMGVLWHEGSIYVASPPDFLRFRDTDGDGVADEREVILTGWNILNTASLHGPFIGPDGWMYLTHGRHGYNIDTKEGAHLEGLAARIWRCRPDGSGLDRFAGGGFDNPVELIFTPAGEMLATMTYFTDPMHGQRDALMHFIEGGVYPKPHESISEFVRTGELLPPMTKFSRIAPAGLIQYRGAQLGAGYEGNLFSAQFNPHRIQRHILERNGGTYKTTDSDFLRSSFDRFYPTDIVQDADGSLLFCDTGAWYVDACPISRVSLPEIKGGIYRIKNPVATPLRDPWGAELSLDNLTPESLVALLDDPRTMVVDNALAEIVRRGTLMVAVLEQAIELASPPQRLFIIQALWRIGDTESRRVLRSCLDAGDIDARVLAAKALGALKDKESVSALIELLDDAPPVQRDAALALGKLGAKEAVPALLHACEAPADPFVDHSLILALIRIADVESLQKVLSNESAGIRKAALIALDQQPTSHLQAHDVIPFLFDESSVLRQTGLWVASRHTDWADDIASILQAQLETAQLADQQLAGMKEILVAYAGNTKVQQLIARALVAQDERAARLALEVMESASIAEFPELWIQGIRGIIGNAAHPLNADAIRVSISRNPGNLDPELNAIFENTEIDTVRRLEALAAVVSQGDTLDAKQYDFLATILTESDDPILKQSAARILERAALDKDQLLDVAKFLLPSLDAYIFPQVFALFTGTGDDTIGQALLNTFPLVKDKLARVKASEFDAAIAGFSIEIQSQSQEFRPADTDYPADLLEKFERLRAQDGKGDVGRGRRAFFSEAAACSTCHAVGDEGGALGPDLTSIGAVRTRDDLLESILFPSANILRDYSSVTVELEWETYTGIIAEENDSSLVLRAGADQSLRIPRDEIIAITPSDQSLMPESLDTTLSDEDLLDIVAFLLSLNNEQWLLPERFEGPEH